MKPPSTVVPLATLTTDEVAAVRLAMAPLERAQAVAERAAMRLQGARADLLDAEDAFQRVFAPICAAHGVDPRQTMRLHDDGTLVPVELV